MFEPNKENLLLKINYFVNLLNKLNCKYYDDEIKNQLEFFEFSKKLVEKSDNKNNDILYEVKDQLEMAECEIKTLLLNIENYKK